MEPELTDKQLCTRAFLRVSEAWDIVGAFRKEFGADAIKRAAMDHAYSLLHEVVEATSDLLERAREGEES